MSAIVRSLLACLMLITADAHAAALFNLRASLSDGYFISGTVRVDTATGMVTDEATTLFRYGTTLSTFGAPSDQGPFTPGGLAASYLFTSPGSAGYLFAAGVPGTSLVGYGGGELCSLTSTAHCAFSAVYSGGVFVGNVLQGILAPATDTVRTFDLSAQFQNGDRATGTVTIDTTLGFVLDEHVTLFAGGAVVDTFYNPLDQSPFAPAGLVPSYLFQSIGSNGVLLNIATPGASLIGYGGGNICATGTALNCAFSNIFLTSSTSSDAVSGRLALPVAAVPEPGSIALVGAGLLGAAAAVARRKRHPVRPA